MRLSPLSLALTVPRGPRLLNSATDWWFALNGLAGTPWADVSRTGLGTTVDEQGRVVFGPHNLLPASDDLTAGSWTNLACTPVSANTLQATSGLAFHYSYVNGASISGATEYRFDVQRVNHDWIFFTVRDTQIGYFNLATGTFGTNPNGATAELLSDGWYRITVQRTQSAEVHNCGVGFASGNNGANATMTGSEQIRIRRRHYRYTPSDTSYVPTTSAARYLPRITHDSVTLARLGLLVEGQATNLLGQTDNLAGSEWQATNNGVTQSADFQARPTWTLTNVAGGATNRYQDLGSVAAATYSCRVRVWAAASSTAQLALFGASSAFASLTATVVSGPGAVSGGSGARVDVSGLSSSVPTVIDLRKVVSASEFLYLYLYPSTGAGDSVRLQVDNVEAGAVATSYIPNPGTGTAVRVADDWALTGAALTAALGSDTSVGALFVEFTMPADTQFPFPGVVSVSSASELLGVWVNDTNRIALGGYGGTAANAEILLGATALTPGQRVRVAIRWTASGYAGCVNGGAVVSSANARNLANATALRIGKTPMSTKYLGTPVSVARALSPSISDAQMQALTA